MTETDKRIAQLLDYAKVSYADKRSIVALVRGEREAAISDAVIKELEKWRPMIRRLSEYVDSPDSLNEYNERIESLKEGRGLS